MILLISEDSGTLGVKHYCSGPVTSLFHDDLCAFAGTGTCHGCPFHMTVIAITRVRLYMGIVWVSLTESTLSLTPLMPK